MKKAFVIGCLFFFLTMTGRFILGGHETATFEQLSLVDKFIMTLGVVSAFGFWFMMLADFFGNKNISHKIAWGFCLFFFSWLSSLVYFILHFLPRHKKVKRS